MTSNTSRMSRASAEACAVLSSRKLAAAQPTTEVIEAALQSWRTGQIVFL